jgi:hypothetical protein
VESLTPSDGSSRVGFILLPDEGGVARIQNLFLSPKFDDGKYPVYE